MENVTISAEEYESLTLDRAMLGALYRAGVSSWDDYEKAIKLFLGKKEYDELQDFVKQSGYTSRAAYAQRAN